MSVRTFDTGATRNAEEGKLDYEGFLSPLVLEAMAAYMNFHRHLEDGTLRASDNWQKGIPYSAYMQSAWRHFMDWWRGHRGYTVREGIVFAMTGLLFNLQGYLHEYLRAHPDALAIELGMNEAVRRVRRERAASEDRATSERNEAWPFS